MRANETVTKRVMRAEAIATGTTMLFRSIGICVTGVYRKKRYMYVDCSNTKSLDEYSAKLFV